MDFEDDLEELKRCQNKNKEDNGGNDNKSYSPDFVITDERVQNEFTTPPKPPPRSRTSRSHRHNGGAGVTYSRSFKSRCPPENRSPSIRRANGNSASTNSPEDELAAQVASISPISFGHAGLGNNGDHDDYGGFRERAIDCGMSPVIAVRKSQEILQQQQQLQDRVDSAYGTDSNRTGSPPKPKDPNSPNVSSNSNGSSVAFNNDTYMNISSGGGVKKLSTSNPEEKSYMSVHPKSDHENSNDSKLLKRSPIVKDVTEGFAQISSTEELLNKNRNKKLSILVPNIDSSAMEMSDNRTISLDILNPNFGRNAAAGNFANIMNHDYENLALININRAPQGQGVTHWRTYSDMANSNHDESKAYERTKMANTAGNQSYYDIYPLSKEMKDRLYRSLTPLSTAATMASDTNTVVSESDTYEPIENFDNMNEENGSDAAPGVVPVPVTLIQHDGTKLSTRRITSMESLKEVIKNHEKLPFDDPEDRADLYLLAPMRILSPIMEESAHVEQQSNYGGGGHYTDLNRSILTVISEILNHTKQSTSNVPNLTSTTSNYMNNVTAASSCYPDGHFQVNQIKTINFAPPIFTIFFSFFFRIASNQPVPWSRRSRKSETILCATSIMVINNNNINKSKTVRKPRPRCLPAMTRPPTASATTRTPPSSPSSPTSSCRAPSRRTRLARPSRPRPWPLPRPMMLSLKMRSRSGEKSPPSTRPSAAGKTCSSWPAPPTTS